ncbi:TetR/AcrR family transcriptional regulator [Streptomyces sp. ST2-7A]|uniref:TetR/AcrR family transcriptional regulator n=1 Tax=Streptomyces sp. ST2-7A TaxID=2907214 RepID=UPI001F436318|nr:TetR/AcrR family transcriptional regulator [Streptomyces sp. ST2-7A]MCE7083397.1 TetR/AcrR family transcriptional regulator [Streptomyces sp. ST2-7A]
MTDDTRTRLVRTARALIHGSSFTDVGIGDVCREAGVHRGSLYHFFPSKDALGLAVIDANRELLDALLDESFGSEAPPLERIDSFIRGFAGMLTAARDRMGSVPGCPIGNLALELSGQPGEARNRIAEILTAWERYFRDAIAEAALRGDIPAGVDPDAAALRALAFLQGITLMAKAHDRPTLIAEARTAIRILIETPTT